MKNKIKNTPDRTWQNNKFGLYYITILYLHIENKNRYTVLRKNKTGSVGGKKLSKID
jgi:hypothetical protein